MDALAPLTCAVTTVRIVARRDQSAGGPACLQTAMSAARRATTYIVVAERQVEGTASETPSAARNAGGGGENQSCRRCPTKSSLPPCGAEGIRASSWPSSDDVGVADSLLRRLGPSVAKRWPSAVSLSTIRHRALGPSRSGRRQ